MTEDNERIELTRRALLPGIGAAVLALLSACGKKGDLEPPPAGKDRKPRSYPKPQ